MYASFIIILSTVVEILHVIIAVTTIIIKIVSIIYWVLSIGRYHAKHFSFNHLTDSVPSHFRGQWTKGWRSYAICWDNDLSYAFYIIGHVALANEIMIGMRRKPGMNALLHLYKWFDYQLFQPMDGWGTQGLLKSSSGPKTQRKVLSPNTLNYFSSLPT